MPPPIIVIKKYANRRLYDTSSSRYINLEELAAMVRNGKEVQVVDAKTREDLTRVTLAQIIMDDARQQQTGLPLELLRQLIVTSDRVGQEFILWYLKSAFDAYQKVQSSVQTRFSEMQSTAMSPINMVKNLIAGAARTEPAPAPNPDLEQLQQRIAELEARLEKPAPKKKRAAKRGR